MNLFMTIGVPGSGKTTWAHEKARELGNTVTISRDDLRSSLYNAGKGAGGYKYTKAKEEMIAEMQDHVVISTLKDGKNVIIHNTHLKESDKNHWREIALEHKADFHIEYFDVSIVELLRRNHKRGRDALPVSRVWEMFNQYRKIRGFVPAMEIVNTHNQKCVIFDVDGTLTKVGQRSPYDFTKVINDPPNIPIQQLFHLYKNAGYKCIVVSGREGNPQCAHDTWVSLLSYGVEPDEIFMRQEGDTRTDFEVKEEILFDKILDKYYPVIAVDDRDTPVGMWRANGIPCLQVDYGDF
ncbi:3' phosphatase and 5' polynucleotide kinase [Klebsiella phage KMI9]|uniref:PseT 3' phosphatase and 5' polynucleotide kinase n=1 Tax=Klebsiella phage KP15 TaxID=707757 RepID=D5JFB3_9CAUD|nr:polynucleotide kinase [Klebsiella phage KP15]ADE34897.1 PseT 3' phosphatase and 5' polynucleotide kinase [Klebsiella phage KP15]QEG10573.1 3' phosphatase and 5' polynucleotide kinase [Klebsiella phage KMI9]UJP30766.1 polynucleotide kinase [Klebsiella phage Kpn35c1]